MSSPDLPNSLNNEPISTALPTQTDTQNTQTLQQTLNQSPDIQINKNHREQRERALKDINEICQEWIKSSSRKQKYSEEFISLSKIRLYTYGSFKIGVHSCTDDIDILCIGPSFLTRDMFFDELGDIFNQTPYISDFNAIPNAYVPVISFKYNNIIDIDIVYAQLQYDIINNDWDINDDSNLYGLDIESILSINGARFANKLLTLIPNKNVFRLSLKAIRHWAKQRGIYSNKIGYLGGVSWAILTAKVCQLYPNANASQIIQKFFLFYHTWNFNSPLNAIMLCDIVQYEDMPDVQVWHPYQEIIQYGAMYVITPTYPAMNSSHNVSISTFEILKQEIARGFHMLSMENSINENKWKELFENNTFFIDYKQYIFIKGCSTSQDITQWRGLIESKIRSFVSSLEYNENISIIPYNKYIRIPLKQIDINKYTHHDILEKKRLKELHLRLRKERSIEQKREIDEIYTGIDDEHIDSKEEEVILISDILQSQNNNIHQHNTNPYCYVAPELQKKYTFNSYAYVVNKHEISCCEIFNNKILKTKAEKESYECYAFVIGIDIIENYYGYYNETIDFSTSVSTFLKGLNHIYKDSHLIIELISVNKLPHFLFNKYGYMRPNKEFIKKHQKENELNYEQWINSKLGVVLKAKSNSLDIGESDSSYSQNDNGNYSNNNKRKVDDMRLDIVKEEIIKEQIECEPANKRRKVIETDNGIVAEIENEINSVNPNHGKKKS